MNRILLKYCLSIGLFLSAVFAIKSNNIILTHQKICHTSTQVENNIHSDLQKNFFSSNSDSDHKNSDHTIFENEIDDDEIKSDKLEHNNRVSQLDIFNHFRISHYLSRVKNLLPFYSHDANTFNCRYILYRVFRL